MKPPRLDRMPAAVRIALAVTLAATFAACTEKPQTAGTHNVDTPAFQGANDAYVAPGWKAGDVASWDRQMTKRAQHQNEYVRIGASAH